MPNIQDETGELGRQDASLDLGAADAAMSAGKAWKGPYEQASLPPQPHAQQSQFEANGFPPHQAASFPNLHPLPQKPSGPSTASLSSANRSKPEPSPAAPQFGTSESTFPETAYIPAPPPKPFSGEDSTDAVALRAAISALQFQKKKAQEDVRKLQDLKKQALNDPRRFQSELAAGRLKEERSSMGDIQAILDASDSDSEEDGANNYSKSGSGTERADGPPQASSNRTSTEPSSSSARNLPNSKPNPPPFSSIPGPQNIIRMPPINWEKYHIVGEPLDALHEQQRRWPGTTPFGLDKGREHAVAAPYSPFYDVLADEPGSSSASGFDGGRKDGRLLSLTATVPNQGEGTVSEHPMETRRGGARH